MSDKPIEPTQEMINAGIKELIDNCGIDYLSDDALSDTVCFIWQAMYLAHSKE